MKTTFKYTDFFDPKDIAISKCWMVISNVMFKDIPAYPMSLEQRENLRKAFYVGFVECFKIVSDISTDLTEADACAVLSRISAEGNAFHDTTIASLK